MAKERVGNVLLTVYGDLGDVAVGRDGGDGSEGYDDHGC